MGGGGGDTPPPHLGRSPRGDHPPIPITSNPNRPNNHHHRHAHTLSTHSLTHTAAAQSVGGGAGGAAVELSGDEALEGRAMTTTKFGGREGAGEGVNWDGLEERKRKTGSGRQPKGGAEKGIGRVRSGAGPGTGLGSIGEPGNGSGIIKQQGGRGRKIGGKRSRHDQKGGRGLINDQQANKTGARNGDTGPCA
ncbi:hypothetical protein niasHT_023553 [Heterodera trifolii]|uniref:Uncharacterized protein n=1 Tax=Heterodera trifolii TaxID=157864 RepID=A0ABD2JEN7_9BILA